MDANQFDHALRAIEHGVPRRRVLGNLLATSVFASLPGLAPDDTDARNRKKRRKRKKRQKRRKNKQNTQKVQLNAFGCVNVGGKCYGNSDVCCSGICDGTGKTSVCVGHHAETCTDTAGTCFEGGTPACGSSGSCFTTTGNAPFCGEQGLCDCAPCSKDADCVAEHGPGAACILCAGTDFYQCTGVNGSSGTACVPAWPKMP